MKAKLLGSQFKSIDQNWIEKSIQQKLAVHFISAQVLVFARENSAFREILSRENVLNMPDGMPIKWSLNVFKKMKLKRRYAGPDCIEEILQYASEHKKNVFIYGSSPFVLEKFQSTAQKKYPQINIVGTMEGLYQAVSAEVRLARLETIKATNPDLVLVGLGGIKQECWIAENQEYLDCACFALGAAFDYFAGTQKRAPEFLQRVGLEWFYRLIRNPRRLFRRYFVGNFKFLIYLFLEILNPDADSRADNKPLPYHSLM